MAAPQMNESDPMSEDPSVPEETAGSPDTESPGLMEPAAPKKTASARDKAKGLIEETDKQEGKTSPGAETYLHRMMIMLYGDKGGPLMIKAFDPKAPAAQAVGSAVGSVAEAAEKTLQKEGKADNIDMPDRFVAIGEMVKQVTVLRARAGRTVDSSTAQSALKIAIDYIGGILAREGVLNVQSDRPEVSELFGAIRNRQMDMAGRIDAWNRMPKGGRGAPPGQDQQQGQQQPPQGQTPTAPAGLLGNMQ